MHNDHDGDRGDGISGIEPLAPTDPPRVGPYVLLGRLGSGGMGRVYLARSAGGRTVAVKVVHEEHATNREFRARFRREVAAARRVGERFTAPVLEGDPDAPRPWVATGYVPGPSLEQVVREHGPLPTASVHELFDGLTRALRGIHEAGIVHRDLKPSNVLLTIEGPRVIDFGIARALQPSVESLLTSTGMVIGSPGFMAPEQVVGEAVGPSADVFALGCVAMYAATGRLPFGHGAPNQHAVMFRIVQSAPDLTAVEDDALRALIARCLAKPPTDRPSVAALLADPARARRTPGDGAWLPPALVARLAQQAARLLDAEAPEAPEAPQHRAPGPPDVPGPPADAAPSPDRPTVGLRPQAAEGAGAAGGAEGAEGAKATGAANAAGAAAGSVPSAASAATPVVDAPEVSDATEASDASAAPETSAPTPAPAATSAAKGSGSAKEPGSAQESGPSKGTPEDRVEDRPAAPPASHPEGRAAGHSARRPEASAPDPVGSPAGGPAGGPARGRGGRERRRRGWVVATVVLAVIATASVAALLARGDGASDDQARGGTAAGPTASGTAAPTPSASTSGDDAKRDPKDAENAEGKGEDKARKDGRDGRDGRDDLSRDDADAKNPAREDGDAPAAGDDAADRPRGNDSAPDDADPPAREKPGSGDAQRPPSSRPTSSGTVPQRYLGTWERKNYAGPVSQRMVVRQASPGQHVITLSYDGAGHCKSTATLVAMEDGGKRMSVGPTDVDTVASNGYCPSDNASSFAFGSDGKLYRTVGFQQEMTPFTRIG
ncbi:serine/threonine-protein kinase [Streptomyces buecherae]|uniref:Protein kinase n=1 Tax=Streptomyces buecherae TaxID=2763006 RepID=A0A7H8NAA2_9ACTN|nr:serine/threonine-protein kinase [Streptomyces buecherae]QKW51364.1 protein kinase [Streptomyces buecherae]